MTTHGFPGKLTILTATLHSAFLMIWNLDLVCQLSGDCMVFVSINFFASFQLQAIIILAVLLLE